MSGAEEPLLVSEQGISKDRRRFIIVTVFDFSLVALLWLLCTVTKGDDWPTIFKHEVNIFDPTFFRTSLFDVAISALIRMFLLVCCYATPFRLSHWFPVAVTTVLTTVLLVLKVLFYFSKARGSLPEYLVILASFIVAWIELWLVPFRVLPRERRIVAPVPDSPHVRVVRNRAHTDDEFRSAVEYDSVSSDDDRSHKPRAGSMRTFSPHDYMAAIESADATASIWLRQIATWRTMSREPLIRLADDPHFGRIYYVRTELPCAAAIAANVAWYDVSGTRKWNKQVAETRTVHVVDANTDVIYSISAPALRGYIAPRDFLDVRRMRVDGDGCYVGVYVSINSSIVPPNANKKMIRGVNGPNLVRISPSSTSAESCVYEWIMNNDVKGEIPRRLVERSMSTFLVTFVKSLVAYVTELNNET